MNYYLSRVIPQSFEEAMDTVADALKKEGFGILSDVDMQKSISSKLGKEFRKYRILGVCDAKLAYDVLNIEDKAGIFMPCTIIVQEREGGKTEVTAIDPLDMMRAIGNPKLEQFAADAASRLSRVMWAL